MQGLNELVWILKAKGFRDASPAKDGHGVVFTVPENLQWGWDNLISRFCAVFGPGWRLEEHEGRTLLTIEGEGDDFEKHLRLIYQAVSRDEFDASPFTPNDRTFDLKLGISCNNNCLHCVIKPNVLTLKRQFPNSITLNSGIGMQCDLDLTYEQVIEILSQQDAGHVVLTGGEPTINPAFVSVLKWLYYTRPNVFVAIQTNGRLLADEQLVRTIRRYTRRVNFAIAIHGLEETHNRIVFNRKETGNPYLETVQGIRHVLSYFPPHSVRSEIVVTRFNIHEVVETVREQYEKIGLKIIGLSYPHLEGFASGAIAKLAPTMAEFIPIMEELNRYAQKNRDLELVFEELPLCIYNQLKTDEIVINSFAMRSKTRTTLNFMGADNDCYNMDWIAEHRKLSPCVSCIVREECIGIWRESSDLNVDSLKPITEISPALRRFMERNWR